MADPTSDSNQTSTAFQTVSGSTFSTAAALTSSSDHLANDLASRAIYVYSFFALLGFGAGCFIVYSFIQTYRAQRRLAWLDCLLWVFCGVQLLLLLLSLHMVAHRPSYMQSTALGCAALSFAANMASLCGLLVLVLMAFVLTLDPPSSAPLRNPRVCAALVVLTSVLVSLLLAGLRGLQAGGDCVMDPYQDGVSYAAAKLSLAVLAPYILLAGLLISGCIRQWRSEGRFLSGSEEGPVFLTVAACMFLCQLFYGVALVRGALLVQSRMEKAFLTVAECVLFSGSSLGLLAVLLLHRPSRESLQGAVRQLRDCCRRPGRAQPSRNIIAPHIEITDTLQDIES
ncbi:uncharacterized protein LOC110368575 [Fundulus heteroclitus]|uniref:uncharacterized protein LOC110368575 n=1 Tax=Fundulus heteroclitus TaxID=8078 RepID=UPI00165B85CE|nr:uncharacterized protein LOC110368575 [Fundulus heteroclitus]